MKLKTKSKKKLALAACLVACVAVCAMVIACKYVNVYPEVTVRFNLNGGSYGGVPAEKLDLAVTGVCFEKLPSSSIFGNFDEFKFDRFDENGDMLMPVWSSDVEGITFEEYILKRRVFPRQDVRFTCTWVPTTITFSAPTVVADGIEFSVTDVSGGSNIPDGTKLSIQTVDTSTQQTVTGFFDESKLNSSNNKIKLVPQKEVDPNVMLNLIATDKNGKLLGKKINMPIKNLYRYFEGQNGEKYAFGMVNLFHLEETSYPAGMNRTTGDNNNQPDWSKESLVIIPGNDGSSSKKEGCNGMDINLNSNDQNRLIHKDSFNYLEFRVKLPGTSHMGWAPYQKATWLYGEGKFEFINSSPGMTLKDFTETSKQIQTTYNGSNGDFVVLGIWNGTSGNDASKALLMEYVNDGGTYRTILHEVSNHNGTENISAGRDSDNLIQFLFKPEVGKTVELDYFALFKKIN